MIPFQRIQDGIAEVLWQFLDDIGEIPDIHPFGGRDQLHVFHLVDDAGTGLVMQVRQYLARLLSRHCLP